MWIGSPKLLGATRPGALDCEPGLPHPHTSGFRRLRHRNPFVPRPRDYYEMRRKGWAVRSDAGVCPGPIPSLWSRNSSGGTPSHSLATVTPNEDTGERPSKALYQTFLRDVLVLLLSVLLLLLRTPHKVCGALDARQRPGGEPTGCPGGGRRGHRRGPGRPTQPRKPDPCAFAVVREVEVPQATQVRSPNGKCRLEAADLLMLLKMENT